MTRRIVATPETCWGAPRLEGTRLQVTAVASRFSAGESIRAIAHDYDIRESEVVACMRAVVRATMTHQGMLQEVYRRLVDHTTP